LSWLADDFKANGNASTGLAIFSANGDGNCACFVEYQKKGAAAPDCGTALPCLDVDFEIDREAVFLFPAQ
jgi:hypothetical protein